MQAASSFMGKRHMRWIILVTAALVCPVCKLSAAEPAKPATTDFVTVQDAKFYCHGKPYYFIGTNYWYGPLLASPGETGERKRLTNELDFLAAHGLRNLRILAGAVSAPAPRAGHCSGI